MNPSNGKPSLTETIAPWYRIRLSRNDYNAGEPILVQGVFYESFIARNGPSGAALYGVWDHDGSAFNMYFTPQSWTCCRALFRVYSAEPCEPPPIGRLKLICGDASRPALQGVEF